MVVVATEAASGLSTLIARGLGTLAAPRAPRAPTASGSGLGASGDSARAIARARGVASGAGSSNRGSKVAGGVGRVVRGRGGGSGVRSNDLKGGEVEGGDLDGADGPGDATVIGGHRALDVLADGEGVDVVGVSAGQNDGDVGPGVGGDETAVLLSALDGGTETQSVAVAGGQGRDDVAGQVDSLGVVAGGVVVLVCWEV